MQHWLGAMGVYLGLGSLNAFLALVLQKRGIDGLMLTASSVRFRSAARLWSLGVLADRFQAPTNGAYWRWSGGIGALDLWQAPAGWWWLWPCWFWPSGVRLRVPSSTVSH